MVEIQAHEYRCIEILNMDIDSERNSFGMKLLSKKISAKYST